MSFDVLEQLAGREVPPPPATLRRDLHTRINRLLLVTHLSQFVFQGFGYACGHLVRGLLGLIVYSCVGKFPVDRVDRPDEKNV